MSETWGKAAQSGDSLLDCLLVLFNSSLYDTLSSVQKSLSCTTKHSLYLYRKENKVYTHCCFCIFELPRRNIKSNDPVLRQIYPADASLDKDWHFGSQPGGTWLMVRVPWEPLRCVAAHFWACCRNAWGIVGEWFNNGRKRFLFFAVLKVGFDSWVGAFPTSQRRAAWVTLRWISGDG